MMKPFFKGVLLVLLVMAIAVWLLKNAVAKAAVTTGVQAMTGLHLGIHSMNVGIVNSAVGIRGLTLENPAGFSDRVMVDLPEIYVRYDLGAFLQQRVHLPEVRLDLKEFMVVRDPQRRLNLDALKVVQQSKRGPAPAKKAEPEKAPEIQIDALRLKIGKVVFKDYTGGGAPHVQEFSINLDERYTQITNPQALAALIVSRALMNTSVAKLTGLDVSAIQSQMGAQLRQAMAGAAVAARAVQAEATKQLQTTTQGVTKAAEGLTSSAQTAAQEAAKTGQQTLNAAGGAVKDAAESLKKAIPFGNN